MSVLEPRAGRRLVACRLGAAAVVVTHDAQLASWADRVVSLREGVTVDGTAPVRGANPPLPSVPSA